jgi:hypothetical protein
MAQYNLNRVLKSTQSKIYNLSDDFVDGIQIYILPVLFSESVSGYNEATNRKLWLLQPNDDNSSKVSILIDGTSFPIKVGNAGESATNPIVFRRSSSPEPIDVIENGVSNTIFPLYGNDNTPLGTDWPRMVNSGNIDLSIINSLPSSGNVDRDIQFYNNHFINKALDDYITFNVTINDTMEAGVISLVEEMLLDCTFVAHSVTFNKKLTIGLELLYGNNYEIYTDSEIGIRF